MDPGTRGCRQHCTRSKHQITPSWQLLHEPHCKACPTARCTACALPAPHCRCHWTPLAVAAAPACPAWLLLLPLRPPPDHQHWAAHTSCHLEVRRTLEQTWVSLAREGGEAGRRFVDVFWWFNAIESLGCRCILVGKGNLDCMVGSRAQHAKQPGWLIWCCIRSWDHPRVVSNVNNIVKDVKGDVRR